MNCEDKQKAPGTSRQAEEQHLEETFLVIRANVESYSRQVTKMKADIDEMLDHYHDNDAEVYIILNNTITLHDHMKRALERNEKALHKPYFGRIDFHDELLNKDESVYIGRGGVSRDATHQIVVDWRAPVANAYYENGMGKCSYAAPGGKDIPIDLKLKRTYEIEDGKLLDYFDSEVIANDDLLTKYLAKNKQAVLGEIVATIQKEQNEIIRKTPHHNIIVQGVAGSGKTTVAMHRISYILYNYPDRFRPDDFYIVGSNHILLNYITGVLPDLDVYGVRQMTMEQLFVRLLYEDWDEKKYKIRQGGTGSRDKEGSDGSRIRSLSRTQSGSRIKGSSRWFKALQSYCDQLEWNTILRESVFLNPKQFVEGLVNGRTGVFDQTDGKPVNPDELVLLADGEAVERYIRQNPHVSMQNKINMLNERLLNKVREEFLGKGVKYTEAERKAILKAYRGKYGGRTWKGSIYKLYRDFLTEQIAGGADVEIPGTEFDVYDLAALAYLYKRIKETEVISEAHHIVIDEAQDFGMMAYHVLNFCIQGCTYTIMGDVSQNIHFGCGLTDWEELKRLLLPDKADSFNILKKSYRNTVEISEFAANILQHGQFPVYPSEPIIRHGEPVQVRHCKDTEAFYREAADICRGWQEKGFDTIAVVCRDQKSADHAAKMLSRHIEVLESDLEKAVFANGIMVLPVDYTKGLEFDTVLILDPTRQDYPVDDGHARLLYVAATRALHELCVLHIGDLTGLIVDPLPEKPMPVPPPARIPVKPQPAAIGNQPAMPRPSAGSNHSVMPQPSAGSNQPVMPDARPRKKIAIVRNPEPSAPASRQPLTNYASSKPRLTPQTDFRQNTAAAQTAFRQNASAAQTDFRQNASVTAQKIQRASASLPSFGDIPDTGKLRPAGHSKIDLSVRWVMKQADGLYVQSRYGILRLSPVGSAILRITFSKSGKIADGVHPGIAVSRTERIWMYREAGNLLELSTDELCVRIEKSTGAVCYMTRDKKQLLHERSKDPRQLEALPDGRIRSWLFLDWTKQEQLYGVHPQTREIIKLKNTARYISQPGSKGLPFLFSDRGYGILPAADGPAFFCDLPSYGSYLYTENDVQSDYYLIVGKRQDTILNAYSYLCGEL